MSFTTSLIIAHRAETYRITPHTRLLFSENLLHLDAVDKANQCEIRRLGTDFDLMDIKLTCNARRVLGFPPGAAETISMTFYPVILLLLLSPIMITVQFNEAKSS